MTIDQGIQFGDLEHVPPAVRLRPDCDKHYAVVAVGSPPDGDLPIFVDLDAMREMEEHAQSDTGVELGGVLLGGQYHDADGAPFVVVTDSLRAQHFEATKGSFKFTHDTWTQISRERDGFGDDLHMVGWYHTHPGWGVFLSHMDTFICEHFFNKPLDVALVIDPCQGERGWFQWSGAGRQLRRTDGFYLTASRFRWEELEYHAAQWEGESAMSTQSRSHGMGTSRAPAAGRAAYPAPVVNISENRNPWQGIAVMGMLTMQFFLLLLLAWRLLPPGGSGQDEAASRELASIEKKLEEAVSARQTADRAQAQLEVLDRVVAAMADSPQGVVAELENQSREAQSLSVDIEAHRAAAVQHAAERDALLAEKDKLIRQNALLDERLANLRQARDKLRDSKDAEIAALQEELSALKPPEDEAGADSGVLAYFRGHSAIWASVAIIVLVVLVGGAGAAIVVVRRRNIAASLAEGEESSGDEPPMGASQDSSPEVIGP